jgi:hypothetical protein
MSRNTYLRNRFVLVAAVLLKSMAASNAFSPSSQANNPAATPPARGGAPVIFLPQVAQ